MWYIRTVEYFSAMKKDEIKPFATTRMDPAMIILCEVNHTEKHKYLMMSLICGI